jgi:hypothetical protein
MGFVFSGIIFVAVLLGRIQSSQLFPQTAQTLSDHLQSYLLITNLYSTGKSPGMALNPKNRLPLIDLSVSSKFWSSSLLRNRSYSVAFRINSALIAIPE